MTVAAKYAADDLDDGLDYTFNDDIPESELVDVPDAQIQHDSSSDEEADIKPEAEADSRLGSKRKKHTKSDNKKSSKNNNKRLKNDDYIDRKKNVAKMDPFMIADMIASKIKHANKDLSNLELNELFLAESKFRTTPDFSKDRTLENYPDFINKYFADIVAQKSQNKLVVVLSVSALRVCEVARALKNIDGGAMKLISKNKLHHDKKVISSKKCSIAVSTPGRLKKLVSEGIMSYEQISAIVVETTFLDVKMINVWDIADNIPIIKELSEKADCNIYLF